MKKPMLALFFFSLHTILFAQPSEAHDLKFSKLAAVWDEAIPLGNGLLGALVWQKDNRLRFSLDRADLWDLRPMKGLHRAEFSFDWVRQQVLKKEYGIVQQYFDRPFEDQSAPSRIPGGALEFNSGDWGTVQSVQLHLDGATCVVRWSSGVVLKTFVQATKPEGWFRFENINGAFLPQLLPPKYEGAVDPGAGGSVEGDDLSRLGYKQGAVVKGKNSIVYTQEGWGGFRYQISVRWKKAGAAIEGVWSISAHHPQKRSSSTATQVVQSAAQGSYAARHAAHVGWWRNYWGKSSLRIPDDRLEKQWYLEQYKFGSAARRGAPPVSLQAIWTADNGRLPPWKGDYHHDLNTQLSYWPSYSGNHLKEGLAYFDHLDENKPNYKRYTKAYFGKEGLAVPGTTTLDGTEMGGWIQYSLSPTIASWLAHHYYLHWRYSMDREFLSQKAYPWIREVALFLEQITSKDSSGYRKLPLSSSPEINNNNLDAWFLENTNYDLALMKFTFAAAAELARELGRNTEAEHWKNREGEFGAFSLSDNSELLFVPSLPYNTSHRHFSHLMAIHPLGLIRWEDGPESQAVIKNSIRLLDDVGPKEWCGYSYSWLANLKARAKDGEGAAKALSIFLAFCSPNSFHLNGDQTKSGYSGFTYRPFTLEGNFAFAAGLQEMLLQSYAGFIEVLPAVPHSWADITFRDLRAEGAFLVSATKANGRLTEVRVVSEKGGKTKLKLPVAHWAHQTNGKLSLTKTRDGFLEIDAQPGGVLVISNPTASE